MFADLYQLLALLKDSFHMRYSDSSYMEKLKPALRLVRERATQGRIDVEEMAAVCGLCSSRLTVLFRRCFGMSPAEYVRVLRLRAARDLLESGEFTVAQAAERTGFAEAAHFSRCFKKQFGVSPKEIGHG